MRRKAPKTNKTVLELIVDVGSPNFSEASWGTGRSSDERKLVSRLLYAVRPGWVSVMDPVAWEF